MFVHRLASTKPASKGTTVDHDSAEIILLRPASALLFEQGDETWQAKFFYVAVLTKVEENPPLAQDTTHKVLRIKGTSLQFEPVCR